MWNSKNVGGQVKPKVRFDILSECFGVHLSRTTEGFYDTRPERSELDVESPNIVPKDRSLNKERGCAAVSIGEKRQRSDRRSWPADSPMESGLA